jgi:TPR repeat protein
MKSFFGHSLCLLGGLAMAAGVATPLRAQEPAPAAAQARAGRPAPVEPPLPPEARELKDESGNTIVHYIAEVPKNIAPAGTTDPAKQVGVIFCLQEHGTPLGNDLFPCRQSLWRQGLSDQFILLATAPKTAKFSLEDHLPIVKLLEWAEKTYPVNPRRVYMYGKGEGSKTSIEFMLLHPNLVTASVTYSWGAWRMPSELTQSLDYANSAPEIYLTLGRRDLENHLSCVRDTYPRLLAKGYHIIYREFDELGDRTYHPVSNDDGLAWATRMRNKNIPPSAAEMKLLAAFRNTPPAPVDGYYPTLALVGGSQAGEVIQKLLNSSDAKVRRAAAETCRHAIFSAATTEALAKKVSDPSDEVRHEVFRALAMYANWRYDAAQEALINVATNLNANPQDRLDAADGLDFAIKLQVNGFRQDPRLFRALVSLLQDKFEPVRSVANGALAPLYTPSGTGAQRRRTPEGGWDKFLADITEKQNGYMNEYAVCGFGKSGEAAASYPGNRGSHEPADLFCEGGAARLGYNLATGQPVKKDLAAAFQTTLKAAEQGYAPAATWVGLMYADGIGVQQSYDEAGKWWVKAAEGGDMVAARTAWNLYRNGEGVDRNPAISNQWAKVIGEPVQVPRNRPQTAGAPAAPAQGGQIQPRPAQGQQAPQQ